MTRSFEYTRVRRITMQVALCAGLAVTVALAWWVGHSHAAALAVKLDEYRAFHNSTVDLDVRPPIGWKREIKEDDRLVFTETPARFGVKRQLHVIASPLTARDGAAADLEKIATDALGTPHVAPRNFKMLGEMGALYEYPNAIIACTVLGGAKPRAVCVAMTFLPPSAAPGPADVEAVLQMAQALKASDPAHPLPRVAENSPVEAAPRLPSIGVKEPPDDPDQP